MKNRKELAYKDLSADDLRLHLIEGDFHLDYPIFEKEKISVNDIEINATIIGYSHWIKFRIRDKIFNELFANMRLSSQDMLGSFGHLKQSIGSLNLLLYGFINYRLNVNNYSWEEGEEFIHSLKSQMTENQGGGAIILVHKFPAGRDSIMPETIVSVTIPNTTSGMEKIKIDTIHTYPTERKVVVSATEIEINKSINL